ncbi:hypothetical protein V6N13_046240 [Hibiscus sabdariffa]|uniref:DUF4216 domain-containing protein n=1 Tax=Hibiscus sabdariffa TaxID=183260 RepID=A0ABR2D9I0_9ROSI
MDEPYVFSSQVKQVFYCHDPTDLGWYVVLRNTPGHLVDIGDGGNMPRRKITSLRTVRDPPLEEEINPEEETGVCHILKWA